MFLLSESKNRGDFSIFGSPGRESITEESQNKVWIQNTTGEQTLENH